MLGRSNTIGFARDRTLMLTIGLCISMAFCISSGCGRTKTDDLDDTVTPVATLFQYTVAEPLSITATELQGSGHTWQGYSVFLRFRPSQPLGKLLVTKGYAETPLKAIAGGFELEQRFQERFSPPWCPRGVKHPRCFTKEASNRWTTGGVDNYLLDEDTGVVYFCGQGI